jgi:hypothetical protein
LEHLVNPLRGLDHEHGQIGQCREGESQAYGFCFIPVEDVYDLRQVAMTLARLQARSVLDKHVFDAAFSRAVAALVRGCLLKPRSLVQIKSVIYERREGMSSRHIEDLADGCYLKWNSKQVRFVTTPQSRHG